MSPPPFVRIEGLTKHFMPNASLFGRLTGKTGSVIRAVQNVSFSIRKGQTYALVGESGSGKSTIAQVIAGLVRPDAGSVVIDGVSLEAGREERNILRRRVQMVFQDPYTSLNPRWRVADIIAEPCHALGLQIPSSEIPTRVSELLLRVGLHKSDAEKYPHQFSGGQRQRIAIARMLAAQAEFVICDEPTSALDVSVQAQILNLMRELQEDFGLTYLFISHNLAVVRFMADHVGVLNQGELVEAGPANVIFKAPKHEYTRQLLSAVPEPTVEATNAASAARTAAL